ncbi:MAG: hypothetical protein D6830_03980, partial [Ignavibacteria bacterium]
IIGSVFIGSITYLFTAFRELFYLRQKKDPKLYFNVMVILFAATYFSSFLVKIEPDLNFIKNSFFVVSIVMIIVNSIRVAWIAFLSKRQKLYLLGASILLSVIFAVITGYTMDTKVLLNRILVDFSPGFYTIITLMMIYATINFGVIFFTTLFHLPTAEAFDRKAKEVSSLANFSRLITQVFDFKELAETVTETTRKVCNSDVAWLAIIEDDGMEVVSVSNIGFAEAYKVMNNILIEERSALTGVKVFNRQSIKVSLEDSIRYLNFESLMVAPLSIHNKISGYLFSGNLKYYSFDEDDEKTIGAFADYAAVALENSLLIKESIEKERLEKELDVAREIQMKIIPNTTPKLDSLEISAAFVPAFEVGGDYYDFFELEDEKLGFVVADVSGKGISAAFIMAEVKGIFESLAKIVDQPKELLDKANNILINSLSPNEFVTAVYGIVDRKNGKLLFSRAGHPSVIILREGKVIHLTPKGIGLGISKNGLFAQYLEQMEFELKNNDIVCLYTDGITEAQDSHLKNFGLEKFEKLIQTHADKNLEMLTQSILMEITNYSKEQSQHDDITLVMFRWFDNKKTEKING